MNQLDVATTLTHVPHTNTILLGYEIGSADLSHDRKMRVLASGKTIRFMIDGIDGYVDADINQLATQAAILLTGE